MQLPIQKTIRERKRTGNRGKRGAIRCCQTSRRSLHSCHSRMHCASFRVFLLPRSCEGTSAACAAPETVCPAHRCSGWSSAWLGACPCCWGGDTKNTCRKNRLIFGKTCRKHFFYILLSHSHSRTINLTCTSFSCSHR